MGYLFCCFQVDQSTMAIRERFGKLDTVLEPGCHCQPWIFGKLLVEHLTLRLQQLNVRCETKTKDEVVTMEETDSQFSSYAAWYKQYENSHQCSEAVPAMVKIPHRMMLDVLLETLGLPPAEYRTRVYNGSRVCVTVLFHTPTSYVGNDKNRMAIPGVQSVDPSMSEDTAAMEAIGYIRCIVKTEIRDYNYSTMKKLKEENQSLKCELNMTRYKKKKLKTKIRSINNKLMSATYKKKQNAMGWSVLTRYMHGFSDRISNMTALNLSSGKGPMDKIINEPLINIEKVARRPKRRVIKSEKQLRAIRMGF